MEYRGTVIFLLIALAGLGLFGSLCMERCAGKGKTYALAPDAPIPALLQAPVGELKSLRELRGKVVVLEFWATWCGKCRDTFPHMEKMRAGLKGKPVVFISSTKEPREIVEPFLRAHPLGGWIALDEGGALYSAFGVRGIPQVFVIDGQGLLRLKISPSFLYQSDIEKALKPVTQKKTVKQ